MTLPGGAPQGLSAGEHRTDLPRSGLNPNLPLNTLLGDDDPDSRSMTHREDNTVRAPPPAVTSSSWRRDAFSC